MLVVAILVAAWIGCRVAFSSHPKSPRAILTAGEGQTVAKSAIDFLSQLHQEGHLPGVASNEHGNVSLSGRLSDPPYSFTARFNQEGAPLTSHYNLVQMTKESPWQLKRAWQTDSNGQIVQEWPLQ